jgi:hypothetical protein
MFMWGCFLFVGTPDADEALAVSWTKGQQMRLLAPEIGFLRANQSAACAV